MKKVIIILISIIIIFTGVSFYLYQTQVKNLPAPQNFLILGLDPRNDQLEKTQVTDTIIFAHLSENSQEVKLISLPRDLWFYPKSFKINQLYQESDSFSYLKENFSLVLGQKIDNVVVITTQDLMSLVDLVGGVDVYLENGFKDDLYPNPDYINSPSSNIPIYKTIEFPSGLNHLTSSNVTEFVRSRKSADTADGGGTDLGRIKRQQLLLENLFSKMIASKTDFPMLLGLYQFWHQQLKTDFTNQDLLGLINRYRLNLLNLKLVKIDIPTGENPKTDIIYHPQKFINKQWVFITSSPNYLSLHEFISKSLLY